MSMLTHRLEQPLHPTARKSVHGAMISKPDGATLQHLCLRALALLSMGAVLTALIALKTAIFMWRFHF
jgi:hypothetical protein